MRTRTISLTNIIDSSLSGPHQRVTRVAETRRLYLGVEEIGFDPDYFYAPVKAAVREALRFNDARNLDLLAEKYHDDKQRYPSYAACARGLSIWLRKSKPTLVGRPQRTRHEDSGLIVRVNPELWVEIEGQQYVIKLYLKDPPATKAKLTAPLHLLSIATAAWRGSSGVGILDVRNGRLYTARRLPKAAPLILAEEIESYARIWARLDASAAA